MNTQDKEHILKSFLKHSLSNPPQNSALEIPPNLTTDPLPQIDLISQLLSHHTKIQRTISTAHKEVKTVLLELSELQTRKQNINKLLDSMTAIKEIKRLSYGLGTTPSEIYKNLVSYFQVKDKVYYCDRYIAKVEECVGRVRGSFQGELEMQLRKSNSENILEISKTLALLSNSNSQPQNNHIIKFYVSELKKQLKIYQEDLLKIPMTPSNTNSSASVINNYIFFDIAKDIMKTVVNMVNNFRTNIIKIGGLEALQGTISAMLETVMGGVLLEIFMRQKKYFQAQNLDPKKMSKSSQKFKQYLNQFCAIWNQIQRLKSHLLLQIPVADPSHKHFQSSLSNITNTKQLITLTHQTSQGVKMYTRYQFNNLLKVSTFVNSIFQNDFEFLSKVYEGYAKGGKQAIQVQDAHDFVTSMFQIIVTPLQKSLQSLNMLLISTLITFANTNLIQQDSFHAFTQLFNKTLPKTSLNQQKYYTSIILLMNTVILMPNILRAELMRIKIPLELEKYKTRLENQIKELSEVCEFKTRQVVAGFVQGVVGGAGFGGELRADYRRGVDKWRGLSQEVNQLFLNKASQLHCSIILNDQFNIKAPKKIITQQGIISLEKQVMTIISFYQAKGCSVLNNFRKLLEYIQIMLADGEQNANKLIKKFLITDPEQIQKIQLLRAMKVD